MTDDKEQRLKSLRRRAHNIETSRLDGVIDSVVKSKGHELWSSEQEWQEWLDVLKAEKQRREEGTNGVEADS